MDDDHEGLPRLSQSLVPTGTSLHPRRLFAFLIILNPRHESKLCVNGSGGAHVLQNYEYLVANITSLWPGIAHTGTASTDML